MLPRWHTPLRATLVALLLLTGGEARADVIDDPPRDCPAGSYGNVCHGGPFCEPYDCQNDDDCGEGRTCQPVMACIGLIDCSGLDGGGSKLYTYEGMCERGACPGQSECLAGMLCLPGGDSTTGGSTGGGSATSTGTTTAGTGGASTGGVATTGSSPTGSATSNGPGTGEAASDGTDGGKGGCACAAHEPALAPLLALGLLPRRRRR